MASTLGLGVFHALGNGRERCAWIASSRWQHAVRLQTKSILDMAGMLKAPKGKRVSIESINRWR